MDEESNFIKFLSKNWKNLLYAFAFLVCFSVGIDFVMTKRHSTAKKDFLAAKRSISQFKEGSFFDVDSFEELKKITARHPELHPCVDGIFALTLVEQGKVQEGLSTAARSLSHVEPLIPPFYKNYSNTSSMICQDRYDEALAEALKLGEMLQNQPEGFEKLEAFNLLRILFLAKKIGDAKNVPLAWEKLKNHPFYSEIEAIFSKGECNLKSYLAMEGIEK